MRYFDSEDVVVILLGLPAGGLLGEEHLRCLSEVVERMWQQRVKPVRRGAFQAGRKGQTHEIIAGVDHHLVPEMCDMLDWVTHSGVVIRSWSCEL